jgi:hypothetical protein
MSKDVVFVQSFLFKCVGLLPFRLPAASAQSSRRLSSIHWRILRVFQPVILLALLSACLGCIAFQATATLWYVMNPHLNDRHELIDDNNLLIRLISEMPDCFYPARAFFILVLFFFKRTEWKIMHDRLYQFIQECFLEGKNRHRVLRKLRKLSVVLFIVTFTLHLVWLSSEWGIKK